MKKAIKKEPRRSGIWDSIFAVLDYVYRIVMLNLLIIIPAFSPVLIYSFITKGNENPSDWIMYLTLFPAMVYLFPAIVSVVDVFKMYHEKTTKGVFKEFFQSLKKHFLKSFLVSIIVVLSVILFTFRITLKNGVVITGPLLFFFNNMDNLLYLCCLFLTISFIIFGLFILIHLPLVMVYFDKLSIWQYLKVAFIMSFRKVGLTLIILMIVGGFLILDIIFKDIFMFIAGISLPLYFLVKLSFKEYIKLYRKVEKRVDEN